MRRGSLGMLLLLAGAACSEEGPPATPSLPFEAEDRTPCEGRRLPIYVDRDGDGASVGGEVGSRCEEDGAGKGYTFNPPEFSGTDCDDSDPERYRSRTFYADADGTASVFRSASIGSTATGSRSKVSLRTPTTATTPIRVCTSSATPTVTVTGTAWRAARAASRPTIRRTRTGKATATTPTRASHPEVKRSRSTGVDSNCDGYDFPLEIDGGSRCEPPPLVEGKVTPSPDCSGADIFIARFKGCTDCGRGYGWIQIGNAGKEAAEVEVVYSALPGRLEFEPIVEALGEVPAESVSPLWELSVGPPGVVVRVRVAGGAEDCSPLNSSFEARLWFVDCF